MSSLRLTRPGLAIVATLVAALCASSAGVLIRAIEHADGWLILFYRALGFTVLVLVLILRNHGRRWPAAYRAIGVAGLAAGGLLGIAFVAFVMALIATPVANVVFVLAAAPLVAAALGALLLGERPSRATLAASAAAAFGVFLAARSGLSSDGAAGVGWALLACLGYAGAIVGLRKGRAGGGRSVDMLPAISLSGLLALAISAVMVEDALAISRADLGLALSLGVFQIGLQYVLITWAARWLPASRIALLMLLEVALAPLWVWLLFGETPAGATLVGGAIVLAALIFEQAAGRSSPVGRGPAPERS